MTFRFSVSQPISKERNRGGATFAFLFCICSGAYALWLAITGPPLGGGLPWLLPDSWNQILGRVVFGVCGFICWGIAILAYRDMRR